MEDQSAANEDVEEDTDEKFKNHDRYDFTPIIGMGTRIHTRIDEDFSKWNSDLSEEKVNDAGDVDIDIPAEDEDVLPIEGADPIKTIAREVYEDSLDEGSSSYEYNCNRVILCLRDDDVDEINDYVLSLLPGEEKVFNSDDCVTPPRIDHESMNPSDYMLVRPNMFGYCNVPGVPRQVLRLKVGTLVMLLTDLDPTRGLLTGARLQITEMGDSLLTAKFASPADYYGGEFVIPKTHMFAADEFPASLRRTQFPLTLAFAMTVDKSRGQTFSKVGLFLPSPLLRDGQRSLAISKVKTTTGSAQVLITKKHDKPKEDAENVVVKKLFRDV